VSDQRLKPKYKLSCDIVLAHWGQ